MAEHARREPAPNVSQGVTPTMPMRPSARRTSGGLVVTLYVGDRLTLHFTGATPDDQALAAIDNLIGGLVSLKSCLARLEADPEAIEAEPPVVCRG